MAFQISDTAAPMPLLRKQTYQTADDARTQTKKVIVKKDQNGIEEKSVFMIRVFSGTTNEDLVCLLVTLNQFKVWAEAKGVWATPPVHEATDLFTEW